MRTAPPVSEAQLYFQGRKRLRLKGQDVLVRVITSGVGNRLQRMAIYPTRIAAQAYRLSFLSPGQYQLCPGLSWALGRPRTHAPAPLEPGLLSVYQNVTLNVGTPPA